MVSLQSMASVWFPAPASMRIWMIRQTSAPWTQPRPTSRPSIAALAPRMVAMGREDCPPGWDYCCCHYLPHWGNYANEAAEELEESRRRRLHLITAKLNFLFEITNILRANWRTLNSESHFLQICNFFNFLSHLALHKSQSHSLYIYHTIPCNMYHKQWWELKRESHNLMCKCYVAV